MAKGLISGDLNFEQDKPILIDSIKRTLYNENPLDFEVYEKQGLGGILSNYYSRSERLKFDYIHLIQPLGSQFKTKLIITVNIPESQEIKYIPGVLETLKFAWTQYLALLIPTLIIFWSACAFLFRHQILRTSIASDLLPKKRF